MKKYKILALFLIGTLFGSVITLSIKQSLAAHKPITTVITRGGFLQNLSGASLESMDLKYHNFNSFNFSNANLRGTTLIYSDLSNSILNGTDFSGANLTGANFFGADYTNTIWHMGDTNAFPETICPDGTTVPTQASSCQGHLVLTNTPNL